MAGISQSSGSSVASIAEALVHEVLSAGSSRGLLGAEAGALLTRLRPAYKQEFSVKNLREFVERHVPDLRVIGTRGGDLIYGLAEWPSLRLEDQRQADGRDRESPWRVWVSPNARVSLAVNKQTNSTHSAGSSGRYRDK
jgi:hypothetical protein